MVKFEEVKPYRLERSRKVAKSTDSIYLITEDSPISNKQRPSQFGEDGDKNETDHKLIHGLAEYVDSGLQVSQWYRRPKPASPPDKQAKTAESTMSHLDEDRPPLSDHDAIYDDIVENLLSKGFANILNLLKGQSLRTFTLCSGTEAPIIALDKINAALERKGEHTIDITHVASCEIEPFKQAYIQRNFEVNPIFRDVTEFSRKDELPLTVYGAPCAPPKDIDILIAGSSCVDYSRMNNTPLHFKIDGESWVTMKGIIDYAAEFHPKLIILENVRSAPWNEIKEYWEREIVNYDCHVIYTDTKDFYLPQTRERGYMVGMHRNFVKDCGLIWPDQVKKFQSMINFLARRATAPFSAFTVFPDDPRFQTSMRNILGKSKGRKGNTGWEACKFRMDNYRRDLGLGYGRPISELQSNGMSSPPDYFANRLWVQHQRPRILESLDIVLLRDLLRKGFNPFYKSRFLDLSQNVDREVDSRQAGIAGCITPDGNGFDTLRGGPLSGMELLSLQGLPTDELKFTIETPKQLIDLAGNAMSATVVATVIAAAIKLCTFGDYEEKSLFTQGTKGRALASSQEKPPISAPSHATCDAIVQKWTKEYEMHATKQVLNPDLSTPVDKIKSKASQSRQFCSCEGYSERKLIPMYICRDCAHTACEKCKANPKHNYERLQLGDRAFPSEFVSFIQESMPRSLKLQPEAFLQMLDQCEPFNEDHVFRGAEVLKSGNKRQKTEKDQTPGSAPVVGESAKASNDRYQDRASKAASATYHYRAVYRSRIWRIEYVSHFGRLELRISPTSGVLTLPHKEMLSGFAMDCQWLLFANCGPKEGSGTKLREVLDNPIASMIPDVNIMEGSWQAWNPQPQMNNVAIKGDGLLQASWEQKLGINHKLFKNRVEFPELVMDFERGILPTEATKVRFKLLPDCAGAQGSLHRGFDLKNRPLPLYFFLDANPLTLAHEDSYVVSSDHHRRNNYERRHIILRFPPGWRPNIHDGQLRNAQEDCYYLDDWIKLPELVLKAHEQESSATVWCPVASTWQIDLASCGGGAKPIIGVKVPLCIDDAALFPAGRTFKFNLADIQGKLGPMEWLLKRIVPPLQNGADWQVLDSLYIIQQRCDCCPRTPQVTWRWVWASGKCKSKVIKPFEDPKQAGDFEIALRSQPSPARAIAHCYDGTVLLEVFLNPQTLAHRAAATLLPRGEYSPVVVSWRIVQRDGLEDFPSFEHSALQDNATDSQWPYRAPLIEQDLLPNKNAMPVPPGFERGERGLWAIQRRLLTWTVRQEDDPPEWYEEEQADAMIPPFNWSLEVQAKSSRVVRGGVIADEVGAGKTTSAIALFAADRENIAESEEPAKLSVTDGRFESNATLIIVPAHIQDQWETQMEMCFGKDSGLFISIGNLAALQCLELREMIDAKIILVPRDLLDNAEYWNLLRKLTYSPNVPMSGGRAFEQWLDLALGVLPAMLDKYDDHSLDPLWDEREKGKDRLKHFEMFVAFRTRADHKKKYTANTAPKAPSTTNLAESKQYLPRPTETVSEQLDVDYENEMSGWKKTQKTLCPLLHLFRFRRLIVDEFQYLQALSLHGVITLSAERRWLLSATPPITTIKGVNAIAHLLGTKIQNRIPRPEDLGGSSKSVASVHHTSHAEEFLRYASHVSASALEARHKLGNTFLDTFVRQNPADLSASRQKDHFVVFRPSALEYATFVEFYQIVECSQINYGCKTTPKVNPEMARSQLVRKWVTCGQSGLHALICCTSAMQPWNALEQSPHGACQSVLDEVKDHCGIIVKKLYISFVEAFEYDGGQAPEPDSDEDGAELIDSWGKFVRSITDGESFDDARVTLFLNRLLMEASRNATRPDLPHFEMIEVKRGRTLTYKKSNEQVEWENDRKPEMAKRAKSLTKLVLELMSATKTLRFFDMVNRIASSRGKAHCARCSKPATDDPASMVVLANCGHVLCGNCYKASVDEQCPDAACSASTEAELQVSGSRFGQDETVPHTKHGSRMEAVCETIKKVLASPWQDDMGTQRILVFVQFDAMRDHLLEALSDNWIDVLDCGHPDPPQKEPKKTRNDAPPEEPVETIAQKVARFNPFSATHTPDTPRVLILKLDSEDAAGWNLQYVNHIMFVAPFVAATQHSYDSIMHQAVGRALRPGHVGTVHVYHFAMAHTHEVNILDQQLLRERLGTERKYLVRARGDGLGKDDAEAVEEVLDGHLRLELEGVKIEANEPAGEGEEGEGEEIEGAGGPAGGN